MSTWASLIRTEIAILGVIKPNNNPLLATTFLTTYANLLKINEIQTKAK